MRPIRCLLAAAALVAVVPAGASGQAGQGGLNTDVRIAERTASPGTVFADPVKAVNLTGRSLRVGVLVRDVGSGADGEPISVPRGTGARSAAPWVTAPPQFELEAGATRQVSIRVAVPKGTAPGGYYASVLFDAAGVEARRSSEHLILINVPGAGATADARIVRFRFPTLSVGGPVDLKLEVANAGNVHAVVRGAITIKDTFGNRVGTLDVPNAIIMPGHQRLLTVRWASPPPLARIRAVAGLDLAGKRGSVAWSGFSLAWWVIAAAIGAFMLPAYGLAVRRRRRARKAREAAAAAKRPVSPVAPVAATAESSWLGSAPPEEPVQRKRRRRGRAEEAELPPVAPPQPPVAPSPRPPAPVKPPGGEETRGIAPFDKIASDLEEESFAPREKPVASAPRPGPVVVVPPSRRDDDDDLIVHEEEPEADLDLEAEEPPVAPPIAPRPPRKEPESAAEEPSWAPVEESEEFEEWIEAVRSAESDLEAPPRRIEATPPEPSRPLVVDLPEDDEEPEHPVPIAPPPSSPRPVVPPAPVVPPVPMPEPERPVPVARVPEEPPVAPPAEPDWPEPSWPDHQPSEVPGWPSEPAGDLTGAAALRRAKVALDMLAGPTGETGAILDAGLELLRSVASDGSVVALVQDSFVKAKGRRKQGPLALALATVSAPEAPAALLTAYATAPKVIADRLQAALATYESAELRGHPALLDALPPARRYSLGL